MKISTKGRYALRMMVDLAQHGRGEYLSLKDISARQNISMKYLEQIAGLLSKAGLLQSARGAQGGYRLAKPAAEYTAGGILRVTEGSLCPVACLEQAPNECPQSAECCTLSFWEGLQQAIDRYVDGVTLDQLAKSGGVLHYEI